jgi:uncharacterized repeat protein (TIGR01451 family)
VKRLAAVLSLSLILSAFPALADRYVAPGGVDDGVCDGTPSCLTINHAISVAAAGETIHVAAGTYAEAVNVNKQLTLQGAGASIDARTRSITESVIQPPGGANAFTVGTSSVTIDGFTAENTTSSTFVFAIDVNSGTTGTQILNNIIQNSVAGISLANTGGTQMVIRHNLIQNNNVAGPVSGTAVYSDQFEAGGTLSNVLIEENTFNNNSNGGVLIAPTSAPGAATDLTIQRNTFTGNGNSILLFSNANTLIADNYALNSVASQIVLGGSNNTTTISGNVLSGGTRGIRLGDFGGGTTWGTMSIHHNSITGQPAAAIDNTATGPVSLVAENNWFGCNGGPGATGCTVLVGAVDANPWLVMTIAAPPGTVPVGSTLPVTVSLNTNSDAQNTSGSGDIVDGILTVTFSAVDGTITPSDTLDASIANATFTGTTPGNGSASGTLHNQTVTAPIVVTTPPSVTATKTVSGTFHTGNNVTYTVVLTNGGGTEQLDNSGAEFTDVLPAGVTLVSANATSGVAGANTGTNTVTWDGSIGATSSVTITIVATINAAAGSSVSNQGTAAYDADSNGTNESSALTDDPGTGAANDPTTFTVTSPPSVTGTKAVSGTFHQGNNVTYTVVLTNSGGTTQLDNPGAEFTDVLPAGLTLVSANAPSGTTAANTGTNTVTWNGSLAASSSVTITIVATINAAPGSSVSNQGTVSYDADDNATNESSTVTDDPGTGAANDATTFTVTSPPSITATKTVAGSFHQGNNVTYTVMLTNGGQTTQPDNAGSEFTDVLPAGVTLVSANAPSGITAANTGTNTVTWNGSLAASSSVTITIVATINAAPGSSVSNQGTASYDADDNGTNEASAVTDDPGTGAANDATTFTVTSPPAISATKTASGSFRQGDEVTYTVVLTNSGGTAQLDNSGDEFTDVLPAGLTLVSANATAGGAAANTGTNTVTWNGSIAANSSVTITIVATIDAAPGTPISNQGTVLFDADDNGTNESSTVTDDPATAGSNDATAFAVTAVVPSLSTYGLFLLAGLLALAGVKLIRS